MSPWVARRWWDFWKIIAFTAFTILFRLRFQGGGNLPRTGPLLILSNHQSFLDPVLLGITLPRYLRTVHRESLRKSRLLTWVMASLNGIPIDHRGFSREGLQATLASLAAGDCVVMFAEGERTHDGNLAEFKPGFSLLLKKSPAPIVPVGIAGAYDAWPRTRKLPRLAPMFVPTARPGIAISIGTPIDPSRFQDLPRERVLQELQAAVAEQMVRAEALRH